MKTIMYSSLFCFMVYYFSSFSIIHGQSYLTKTPYKIDVKKNINNIKTINLSNIGTELSYIPLETTPECLIKEIGKIDFNDLYIFVSEFNRLLQFNRDGKFLRQIGSQGRGPGQYYSVVDFCVDEQNKEIYIISNGKLHVFSMDGIFKDSFKLSFNPAQIIIKDQQNLMYHLWNVPMKTNTIDNSWIISNRKGITLGGIKNCRKRISQPGLIVGRTPLYIFNNTVHFMEFGIDTLYYFQDNRQKPYAIFDLDNLKMDPDPLITSSNKEEIGKKLFGKVWINSVYEDKDFLFMKFFRGITDSAMCACYNKKSSDFSILKGNIFKNDLDGGMDFWPRFIVNDTILVDYTDAFDLLKTIKKHKSAGSKEKGTGISKQLTKVVKQLTETSNPVLVLLK